MMVNCVAYREGLRLGDIPLAEVGRYLRQPGHLVWMGLKDPAPGELEDLRHRFDLHPLAAQDACREHERPKLNEYDDDLFVVMQLVKASTDGALGHSQLAVLAGPGYVITVRTHSRQGFEIVRDRCERESKLLALGSGYVLYALMDEVVDRYVPILEQLQADLESIDEHIFAPGPRARTCSACTRSSARRSCSSTPSARCCSSPASSRAGACRWSARACSPTTTTSWTTWRGSTRRSTPSAKALRRRSR